MKALNTTLVGSGQMIVAKRNASVRSSVKGRIIVKAHNAVASVVLRVAFACSSLAACGASTSKDHGSASGSSGSSDLGAAGDSAAGDSSSSAGSTSIAGSSSSPGGSSGSPTDEVLSCATDEDCVEWRFAPGTRLLSPTDCHGKPYAEGPCPTPHVGSECTGVSTEDGPKLTQVWANYIRNGGECSTDYFSSLTCGAGQSLAVFGEDLCAPDPRYANFLLCTW